MSDITLCPCEENWMEIKNKNGSKYLLSSKGRLYSYLYKRFIGKYNGNYVGGFDSNRMHRLVAKYFINNGNDYNLTTDHINTNKKHNCICNLKICSQKENSNNPITRKNISKGKKGCKSSFKGKHHTEENKKILSEKLKGREPWNKGKKAKKYCCINCKKEIGGKSNLSRHYKSCIKK